MTDRNSTRKQLEAAGISPADTHCTSLSLSEMEEVGVEAYEHISPDGLALAYLCPSCPHIHLLIMDGLAVINIKLRDSQAEKLANMLLAPGTFNWDPTK